MEAERQRFDSLVIHTPHGDRPLRAALDLLDLRLPRAVRAALARLRRPLRDGEGERARRAGQRRRRDRGRDRPRRDLRAAGRRRARLAPRAAPAATATSRPTRRSRAGSRSTPAASGEDLEIWIDRRYVPAGYGWSFPAERRAADRRRLLRPPLPRHGDDRAADRGPGPRPRPLPGQLDPAQAAPRHRGRRLLRRRLGRPLPAADRRGDPHRALLRDRAGARAARRRRGPPETASGPPPATPSSTTRTSGSSAGCCARSDSSRGSRRACSGR